MNLVYKGLYKGAEKEYKFDYCQYKSKDGLWAAFRFIVKQIKKFKPEIVLVPECGFISLIVVLYKYVFHKSYRIVSMIDDSYNMLVGNNQFTARHKYGEKFLIPHFSNIINVEPRVADYFQKRYHKGIYFPIIRDEERFRGDLTRAIPISNSYLDKYHLRNQKVIMYVGRFVALKNVLSLIDAVKFLGDNDVSLVLVGAGPEEYSYRKAAENMNVVFAGAHSGLELYAWYNVADIFVLPSIQEPFGTVTNEALMAGCKCLISNIAGSCCLIKDSINGYSYNPFQKNELVEMLKLLLNSIDLSDKKKDVKECLMQTTFKEEFQKVISCLNG
jgi:glycosyltransferase involved in cell wall biosynthesis